LYLYVKKVDFINRLFTLLNRHYIDNDPATSIEKPTQEEVDFIKQNYISNFYDFISTEDKAQLIRKFVQRIVNHHDYADIFFDVHKNDGDCPCRMVSTSNFKSIILLFTFYLNHL